jgi:hypothetical protein
MGRQPTFTRAQRIERGLPLCRTPECSCKPYRAGWCFGHYQDSPKNLRRKGTVDRCVRLTPDLALALSLEASASRRTLSGLVQEAAEEWLARRRAGT